MTSSPPSTGGRRRIDLPAGAILDLDGTVYRGETVLPGATRAIERLRGAGTDVRFVTNSALGRPATYAETLREFGIPCDPDDVVTAADVTASYLAREHAAHLAYVVGEAPLRAALREVDVPVTSDPSAAEVVVASLDRSFDYDTLADVGVALADGRPYVATNPDRTCPTEDGEIPGTGAILGAIEGVTGRRPDTVAGKPSSTMLAVATRQLGHAPGDCLLVGDRLDTDIAMGERAGMETALVLTGVTDRETAATATPAPDYVIEGLDELATMLS